MSNPAQGAVGADRAAAAREAERAAKAKALIPPAGSEERDFWIEAAIQHGFEEARDDEYLPVYDPPAYLATADEVLALMASARQQGRDDAAPRTDSDEGTAGADGRFVAQFVHRAMQAAVQAVDFEEGRRFPPLEDECGQWWHTAECIVSALKEAGGLPASASTPAAAAGVPDSVRALSEVKQGVVALRDQARSNLAFYREHGSDLALLENQNLAAYEAVLGLFASHPAGQSAGSGAETVKWGSANTVGELMAQLRTLPADAKIFGTFKGPPDKGEDYRTGVRGVLLSRERIRGRWIRTQDKEAPYEHVIWTVPEPAPDSTRTGDEGTELRKTLTLIRDFAGSSILVRNDALDHIYVVASKALDPNSPIKEPAGEEDRQRIPLSPGYHAIPGESPSHQHDIYTTAPPFEGNRCHVGTLSKAAVEAWAASSTEMATALLFALEHDDDKDVADFLRDWMRGDTSRWFEFTAKYRKALAQRAALLASLPPSQEALATPWSFDMEAAPRDGTPLDLWCFNRRVINYRWDREGRAGGWWSDVRHKDRHWRDRECLMPASVSAWRIADAPPASSGQGGR